MGNTKIEWTDKSWSPLRVRVRPNAAEIAKAKNYTSLVQIAERMAGRVGPHCEHVSAECLNCYAETNSARCLPANGTGLPYDRRSRDLVEPFVDEHILTQPLKWRKGRKIFVANQTDLFGEWYTDEMIDRVFAVMALDYDMHWSQAEGNVRRPHHTWQVLTKRPARMLDYIYRVTEANRGHAGNWFDLPLVRQAVDISRRRGDLLPGNASLPVVQWVADGMPGLWLGISCGDQKTADERIPLLLQTPAAKRFVSYEPALGSVDFFAVPQCMDDNEPSREEIDGPMGLHYIRHGAPFIDWIIVGGESGPGARPFDIAWARNTIRQCREAGVACFVKQLGAKPFDGAMIDILGPEGKVHYRRPTGHELIKQVTPDNKYSTRPSVLDLKDRKGGEISEWPEDLRVREMPGVQG